MSRFFWTLCVLLKLAGAHYEKYVAALLVVASMAAGPARAAEPTDDRFPAAFLRVAPGVGLGSASNEFDGPAVTFSLGIGPYINRSFAPHLTGAGTVVSSSDNTEYELYFYGLGLGMTYFPAESFFVSTSVLFGKQQFSNSSSGITGPGVELMFGSAWGEGSMKYGVSLGILGWGVEPPYGTRQYGVTPSLCLTFSLK